MASQTIANLAGVVKDAWTSSRMAKQFYDLNPLLDRIREVEATTIGLQAQVPILKNNSMGYTSTSAAGGVLNPAIPAGTDQAVYTLVYHWIQMSVETAVLNQTGNSAQSIIAGKDLEMQTAIAYVSRQASRQIAGNGDGLIAQCTTTTTANEIELLAAASGGLGYDAIVRGHLQPGMLVDIGTTADTDAIATGVSITAVEESATTPSITVSGSTVSTTSSHYVSIANPNSATAANPELNGFRNMFGSATATLGGINPATAGNEYWKPARVDTSTTTFSLDMALALRQAVFQKTGTYDGTEVFTSAKQDANFYSLLQNQVRFAGDGNLGAGGSSPRWNGQRINVLPDIYDKEWYVVHVPDLIRVVGSIKKPTWTSELEGAGGDIRWSQGTTAFVEGAVFPFQIGVQRRNSSAAATALTA
jgi:hypothetical protein